ncbi:MAG: PEP-CTERM sorting domain-containing protein [Acidobacteriota bacterium]|nr:PEP-CTERM sorting domain-containing protein [Acidobacteriota bacterium]
MKEIPWQNSRMTASLARLLVFPAAIAAFPAVQLCADTVTFAQFQEAGQGGNYFSFVNSGNSAVFQAKNPQNGMTSIPVTFDFLSFANTDLPADLSGPQAAEMSFFVRTSQPVIVAGNFFEQNLYAQNANGSPAFGTITITRDTPDAELHKTNLLTVSFYALSGGLSGVRKGQTASLTADNGSTGGGPTDYVQFSSSYLTLQQGADENLALSFTSASPCFTRSQDVKKVKGGCVATDSLLLNLLHSFTAAGTGTFASDPSPASIFATPEPRSLWLMLLGLVALAAGVYRRNSRSAEGLSRSVCFRHR